MGRDLFRLKRSYFILGIVLLTVTLAGCSLAPKPATFDPLLTFQRLEPDPNLSPAEVIKIQVEALQFNDPADRGIEITYRFASPGNKRFTGPLPRFARMIKNPLYQPMLNHQNARYGSMEIVDDEATQRVTLIDAEGNAIIYVFVLSKQTSPPCFGCWMTDSVGIEAVKPADHQEG